MIQLTLTHLLLGASTLFVLLGVLQYLLANWIRVRLEQSIRHEYDKQLEEYRFLLSKREKIANIASFFARWIKYRGHEAKWVAEKDIPDYYEELTRMSFELVLWIDDEEFLKEVMKRLRNDPAARDPMELLLRAKELVSGSRNKTFQGADITLWPADSSIFSKGPS